MVNENDKDDIQIEIGDDEELGRDEPELEDIEAAGAQKLKQLRQKLAACDEEKRQILEDAAREKADFLNARRRLETERAQDKIRYTKKHIEALLPLADSFQMAMSNKDAWEKADENWRKGIEGINTQLQKLIESYGVTTIDPLHEPFDPYRHEAIGTLKVDDAKLQDKVVAVMQRGYEIKVDDRMEVIRPARVTTGEFTE